jgi:lipoate-protein ligase B
MGVEWYEAQGIEVRDTDRGGLVTYHGPGQLVAYPIVHLGAYGDDVHMYVRGLERVMIESLGEHGVSARTIEGLTGVWVEQPRRRAENPHIRREIGPSGQGEARKIGSIGLHVSRGVTTHGLAVNVNNDLQPFEWVVPCGIEGVAMTSLSRELGAEQGLDAFAATLVARYAEVFGREPVPTPLAELGLEAPPATLSGAE